MNKKIGIGVIIAIIIIVASVYTFTEKTVDFDSPQKQTIVAKIFDIPEGLNAVTISGKIKKYETPSGAPQSDYEPEFMLFPDENYPEINGAIQVALYNVKYLPEDSEHVQITGHFNPKNPDWYYPEQTQRTQQVIFVENIIHLDPIDLKNEFTTAELRLRYDKIQNEFQSQKDLYSSNEISKEQYLNNLDSLIQDELKLYQDVKDHTFGRDEMTEYNFWYRGVMKFPTTIEQEVSRITQQN
jgi:hypothetical protein